MSSTNPEEIILEVEKDVSTLRYSHQRAERFISAGKLFKQRGDTTRAQEMVWEYRLFCLRFNDYNERKPGNALHQ